MTIQVIGTSNFVPQRAVCRHCSTTMTYVPQDTKRIVTNIYEISIIKCPECKATIPLTMERRR